MGSSTLTGSSNGSRSTCMATNSSVIPDLTLPDGQPRQFRESHYLIGLLVCQADTTVHYAFWADTAQDERHIWQQFVDKVRQFPDAPIYHYGSYEPRALAMLAKRYETDSEDLIKRLINVHRYIYGKVYFPVRS